jgi:ketosteroid isomerase-like protein
MRITNCLFTIGLLFLVPAAAFGQKAAATAKADPTEGVKAAFERLVEGIRQSDVEKVMSVYENSPRILFFNNNGSVTQGWETMKTNREQSYPKTKNVSLEVTGLRVEMLGPSAAYATCKWKQTQEFDGNLENASGRMTLVFRRIGKDWKVVHLHTSPDNPPSTRPVLPSEKLPEKATEKKP